MMLLRILKSLQVAQNTPVRKVCKLKNCCEGDASETTAKTAASTQILHNFQTQNVAGGCIEPQHSITLAWSFKGSFLATAEWYRSALKLV
jgi:hypothetical protein